MANLFVKTAIRIATEEFQTMIARGNGVIDKVNPEINTEGMECSFDNPYVNRVGVPLVMDWIKPADTGDKELPVIVLVHGGLLIMDDHALIRRLGVSIARRGYLVAILTYRLIPKTDVMGQLDDVCAGLDYIGRELVKFNVDFNRMFIVAESAGAFLATYVSAMQGSKKLQDIIGYKPTRFRFKAMGLISGMFYSVSNDAIGNLMNDQYFGDKMKDPEFLKYMTVGNPEILNNMPPVFLITSRGDMLNRDSLDFYRHLKRSHKDCHLLYFGNANLMHSFLIFKPEIPEGTKAIDKMLSWFEEKAKNFERRTNLTEEEKTKRDEVGRRMQDKTINQQKMWKLISETNSVSEARLNNVAIIDGTRTYTYRQMIREWKHYAEIFEALGVNSRNHSRVGITSAIATEVIFSTYALNMLGASVSIIPDSDLMMSARFRDMIRAEHITDLLLVDYCVTPSLLKSLMNEKDELGLRNIIVIHSEVAGPCTTRAMRKSAKWMNKQLRKTQGVLFFRDLLERYETTPFTAVEETDKESAIIFHTSGTTKGIHKPIPLSDEAMNDAATRMAELPQIKEFAGKAKILISVDPANSYGMVNQIHMPLVFGCTLVIVPMGANTLSFCNAITRYKADIIFSSATYLDVWAGGEAAGRVSLDFSSVKMLVVGGSYVSESARKRYNEFLAAHGSSIKLTNGYGLSEAGGACILADPEAEGDEIGFPLPSVNVKILDSVDNQFYSISDGPRIGVMYINSASLSMGKIDGETFFEPEYIDGQPYICTYDQVQVSENGGLTFLGRMDRYYVNNEGMKFDAGLVETLMTKQDGIKEAAVVPLYDKLIHDTQPGLVVSLEKPSEQAMGILKTAMVKEFVQAGHFAETNLPVMCAVVAALPHNATGKVDVHALTSGQISGQYFTVTPVRVNDKLVDIQLGPVPSMVWQYTTPDGLEAGSVETQSPAVVMMLAGVSDDLVVFPYFGYWVNFIKENLPALYKKLNSLNISSIMQMMQDSGGRDLSKTVARLQPEIMRLFSSLNEKERKEMQTLFDLFKEVGGSQLQGYGMPQAIQGYGMPQTMQGYGMPQTMQGYGMPQAMQGYGMPQAMQGYGMPQTMQGYGMPQTASQAQANPQQQANPQSQAAAPQPQPQNAPNMTSYGALPMQQGGGYESAIMRMNNFMGGLFNADQTSHDYEED